MDESQSVHNDVFGVDVDAQKNATSAQSSQDKSNDHNEKKKGTVQS